MNYENYHKHTDYSNIYTPDCIIKPLDIAKRAVELGQKTICSLEHGFIGDLFNYYSVAEKYNLKLIVGAEFYFVFDRKKDDNSNYHIVVLAKNNDGVDEIREMMSIANKDGFYYKPRIDMELLLNLNPNNVIITTACLGSFIGKGDNSIIITQTLSKLKEHFKENIYLEIQCHLNPKQIEYNQKIKDLSSVFNIKLIHGCDTHYINQDDKEDRNKFIKGQGIDYPDEEGFILDYPSINEIIDRYKEQGILSDSEINEALNNTNILLDFEDIIMTKEIKMPNIYPNLTPDERLEKLRKVIMMEFKKQFPNLTKEKEKEYKEAIKYEFDIIKKTNEVHMADYFLINYEIIKMAINKYNGVLTKTGRGSAGGFLINRVLGFTNMDRLNSTVKLYPTRFISVSRVLEARSLADIDYNVADAEPFVKASKDILGENNVVGMIAYGTYQEGAAFRNLCRYYQLNFDDYNEVAKNLDNYRDSKQWKDIIDETKKFVGVITSFSIHPCAYVLLSEPVSKKLGIIKAKENFVCLLDSTTADYWKYLKNDYLTVTVVDIIDKVYKLINKPIDNIDELLSKVDDSVWKLYADGITETLNQTGSDFAKPKVVQYKPKSIAELSAFVAAIRPGFSSMMNTFLTRIPFSYNIKEFDDLLTDSQNFVLYQENVMSVLEYAGFPSDETYSLVKAIAKKKPGIIEPIEKRFKEGFIRKLGSVDNKIEATNKVWQIILDNVKYGFNSAHSLAVGLDSLYGAYLKRNYPLEYYTVVLNSYSDDKEETKRIINELSYFNIKLEPISYGFSKDVYRYNKETNSIYKGMKSIKYLNEKISNELYDLGKKEHKLFIDLYFDIYYNTSCDTRQLEILVKLDFFRKYGSVGKLINLIDEFKKGKNKLTKSLVEKSIIKRFDLLKEYELNLTNYKEFSDLEIIKFKLENDLNIENNNNYGKRAFAIIKLEVRYGNLKLELMKLSTGEIINAKIKSKSLKNLPIIKVFDFIKITKLKSENQWYFKDNEWIQYNEKDNRKEKIIYDLEKIYIDNENDDYEE